MANRIVLSLYKNSRNAVIGDLYVGDGDGAGQERVLATTHPATIAAAIYTMAANTFVFKSDKGEVEFPFPIQIEDLPELASFLDDQDQGDFISGFATFSQFDFLHPLPWDTQADIHHRVAAHHLGEKFVCIAPTSPPPKGFKKELKNRNRYIYYPWV